ncbi:MAG: glycosyltransferase family 2 protein [Pedobacter sp.]
MNDALVSVIIPAYGQCPHIQKVVQAVLHQSIRPFEIVVVHSGSHDPSEKLTKLDKSVRVIHRDVRTFAGDARNIGLKEVCSPWVAFIDSDVLPASDWLASLLSGALNEEGRFVVGSVDYATTGGYWGLCLWTIEFSGVHPYLPDGTTQGGASANMLLPLDAVKNVGGFPEGFAASEDSYLTASLREYGLINWFCADARVKHFNKKGMRHCLAHLLWLGHWSAICRREKPLRGALTVKIWPLAAGLWVAKLMLIYCRAWRWNKGDLFKLLTLGPGIVTGLLAWNLGFLSGLSAKRPIPSDVTS